MHRVVNGKQMQETDRYTIDKMQMPAMVLMEKAAEAVARKILEETGAEDRILVVCGSGNNGGDGMAIARMLHLAGKEVSLYLAGNREHFTRESAQQWQIAVNYGVNVVNNPLWDEYTVFVDALFGTGLSREVAGAYGDIIRGMNNAPGRVYAVDIPSGVHAGTGQILGVATEAAVTVTFGFYKTGCLLYPGAAHCGRLELADVGIYAMDSPYEPDVQLLEAEDLCSRKKRPPEGNKGTFGKVLLLAGNEDIYGAAYMSAKAAFLSGAGMVKVLTSAENCRILKESLPEAMTEVLEDVSGDGLKAALAWADYVGVGPGIGKTPFTEELLSYILSHCDKPMVLDADALNVVSEHIQWLQEHKGPCIVTPHMGEMSRLTGESIATLKSDALGFAQRAAQQWQTTVVLKDARTCIADPDGRLYIHAYGNSGMATAGSGDVLTGTILGQLGACGSVTQAACMGVLLHGLAGDLAAGETGETSLMATDICRKLPEILQQYEAKGI